MSVEIDPKLCFVLMPMRNELIGLYEDVIKPTVMDGLWDRIERPRVMCELQG